MHESGLTTVHPSTAKAMRVGADELFRIRLLLPNLMAGLWALGERDAGEYLSVQHSRTRIGRASLRHGDVIVSNRDRAVLTWVDGTARVAQTALSAACDHGFPGRHGHYKPGQCEDRFRDAFGYGLFGPAKAPCPLNLHAHDDDHDDDAIDGLPTQSSGTHIVLRAEIDLIVLVSPHPHDTLSVGKVFLSHQAPAIQIQSLTHSGGRPTRPGDFSDLMPAIATSRVSSSTAETRGSRELCHD